jgi:DNA-binding Xre family transcriptional regulator
MYYILVIKGWETKDIAESVEIANGMLNITHSDGSSHNVTLNDVDKFEVECF